MFTTLMNERINTKVAVVGGKPGEPIEYKGQFPKDLSFIPLDRMAFPSRNGGKSGFGVVGYRY
jgi:hypothetical protein